MSFSAERPALREGADRAARDPGLVAALAGWAAGCGALDDPALRRAMGAAAHARAHVIPGWDMTARVLRSALERIAP